MVESWTFFKGGTIEQSRITLQSVKSFEIKMPDIVERIKKHVTWCLDTAVGKDHPTTVPTT